MLKSINFNSMKRLSTSASLVLAAETENWNQKLPKKLIPDSDNWDPVIRRQLSQLGFFELFEYEPTDENEKVISGLRIIKYIKGKCGDSLKAQELRVKIEEMVGSKIKKAPLFQGLSEAITNVTHHAYPQKKNGKNWYMTASYNPDSTKLRVAFYDQGVGIPSSLPNSNKWGPVSQFLADKKLTNDHPSLIKAAMEVGRTSTGESYRGKGLQDLLEFIDQYGTGYLSIISQRGLYRYTCEKGKKSVKSTGFKTAMPGTLIIWTVTLG